MLEKLQELFPEMAEGVLWYLTVGNFRNVLDFLAKMLDEENLPLTHGMNSVGIADAFANKALR